MVDPQTVCLPRVGLVLMMIGFFFHFGGKLNLRRSFGLVPAAALMDPGLCDQCGTPDIFWLRDLACRFLLAAPSAWNGRDLCGHLGAPYWTGFPRRAVPIVKSRLSRLLLESSLPTDPGRTLNDVRSRYLLKRIEAEPLWLFGPVLKMNS